MLLCSGNITFGCVDYLSFGEHYKTAYDNAKRLQESIPSNEVTSLFEEQYALVLRLANYLSASANMRTMVPKLAETIKNSLVVRMLYFEILLEYLFLFQNGKLVRAAKDNGELFNKHVKDLIFSLNPELSTRFSLTNLRSDPFQVDRYLHSHLLVPNYDSRMFFAYLSNRILYYADRYLLSNQENFIGHLLFRYFNERSRFEQLLARQLWQEAALQGITAVTYRLPKGEIGLLPTAKVQALYSGKTFNLKLSRQMTLKHSAMRDPYTKRMVSEGHKIR